MEIPAEIAELIGACVLAIPLTARAFRSRAAAHEAREIAGREIASAVKSAVGALETRLAATETKHTACETQLASQATEITHLKAQVEADNDLISAFAENKTRDDGIIRGMRAELDELRQIVQSGGVS